MKKQLKNIQTFEQHTDKNLNISDVIVSNKIILRGNFSAKIVDGNVEIVFDEDYDRIYVDSGKLFNEFCNLQFGEDDNGIITDVSVEDNLKNETANSTNTVLPAVKIAELNLKNESKTEYSLGDVMLLDKWEKQLEAMNYTRTEIEAMSPSFYGR